MMMIAHWHFMREEARCPMPWREMRFVDFGLRRLLILIAAAPLLLRWLSLDK